MKRLADYVFNTALIPKLMDEYAQFAREEDSAMIKKWESLKERMSEVKKEISNLLMLAAKVASEALGQKLEELENEKKILQEQFARLCDEVNAKKVSMEKL